MKEKLGKIKWEVLITIIISLTGVFIAIKANNISKLQAEIARSSALPNIGVDEKIQECSDVSWEESSIIEISNLSGKMNNYQAETITFLTCGYFASDTAEYVVVDIPIVNYYLVNIREGATTGLIETKTSAGNYNKIKNLQAAIRKFNNENENGQSIDTYIQTYLKISYTDLLNEKQTSYYLLDPTSEKMIDSEVGQTQFESYNTLATENLCINTNRVDEVSVNEMIEIIEEIACLGELNPPNQDMGTSEESKMKILNEPIFTTLIGAVIGLFGTILGGWLANRNANRQQTKFAASVLYNDLMSIERYLINERSSVNLRYSDNWQNLVADCSFLRNEDLELLYLIYDEVYNFNYLYKCKEKVGAVRKEDIHSYITLKQIMFDTSKGHPDAEKHSAKYEKLIQLLARSSELKKNSHDTT